jgi:uncharacterized membrane protein YedE/YeeE
MDPLGLGVGAAFGAALVLSGLADPDKIVGGLRLRDLHVLRVIAVFVLVGMLGTWLLSLGGWAHYDVKSTMLVSVVLGGVILGIGFGISGYCPGTGLAAAASGRVDALVTVLGMLAGAFAYILIHPSVAAPLEKVANAGKKTLPDVTGIPAAVWVIGMVGGGALVLFATRPRRPAAPPPRAESPAAGTAA